MLWQPENGDASSHMLQCWFGGNGNSLGWLHNIVPDLNKTNQTIPQF